jgi:hypothetical protein
MKPDNKKVSAILGMKPPEDAKSLQSFLGLLSYLTRYSGHLSTLSSPLRDLTKNDVAYSWGQLITNYSISTNGNPASF